MRRVVITGMGVITSIGIGIDPFWKGLLSSASGVKKITHFDTTSFPVKIAAEVRDFNPETSILNNKLNRLDRFSQFALTASHEALVNSRLEIKEENSYRTGVILGTSVGGIVSHEKAALDLFTKGYKFLNPLSIPLVMYNAGASHIAMNFGIKGVNYTVTTACASSSNAIGEAYKIIKDGYADTIVTGGADATLSPVFFAAWCKLRAMSTQNEIPERACKPFSRNRDGLVLGEGAGILVLEELEQARKRSAPIYAELIGYGNNNDAHHLTFPDIEGEVRAVEMAIKDAAIDKKEISYINAHGTATKINDRIETAAIKRVFGAKAYEIPVSSTKSMIGHTLGASGAIELITCTLAINNKVVPPTINYEIPDPECDLDYVPEKPREMDIKVALSNSFGFGGTNVALLVKRYEESIG